MSDAPDILAETIDAGYSWSKVFILTWLLMPFTTYFRGWAMVKIWNWFIGPWFALPSLSIPVAMGMILFLSAMTNMQRHAEQRVTTKEVWTRFFAWSLACPMFVGFAWLILKFFTGGAGV